MTPLLSLKNVSKTFGSKNHTVHAVHDVSFDVFPKRVSGGGRGKWFGKNDPCKHDIGCFWAICWRHSV